MLLVGRVVQAGGTAVMMPLLMTTLMTMVPAAATAARVMGNVTLAISVAPALGPAVSGVVLSSGRGGCCSLLVLPIAGGRDLVRAAAAENIGEPRPATSTGSASCSPRSASAAWSTG